MFLFPKLCETLQPEVLLVSTGHADCLYSAEAGLWPTDHTR
jgi:hypothetical protein